ncbi:MAG: hypothetical protein WCL14_08250, partial [Bacteroidota bacterium]
MKTITHKTTLTAIAFIFALFMTGTLIAQPLFTPYTVTRTTGITYQDIYALYPNNVAIIPAYPSSSGWRCGACTYNTTDDNLTNDQPIGFTFNFDNTNFTNFKVSTNGFITFSSTGANGNGGGAYGFVSSAFYTNGGTACTIAAFYQDLVTQGNNNSYGTLDTSIVYYTQGVSPYRVLTVEWRHLELYGLSLPDLNFQIKLYETTNNIELVYGTMVPGNGSYSYVQGINSITYGTTTAYRLTSATPNTATYNANANYMSTVPANNTKITFSRITTDLGVFAISPPVADQCTYTSSESIVDSIKNYGVGTYDFAAHPDTIITQITGAATQSFTTIINSGTLTAGSVLAVNVGTINMTAGGVYNFKAYSSLSTDLNHNNDTTKTTFTVGTVAAATSQLTICSGQSVTLTASTPGFGHVFPVTYSPVTLTSPTTVTTFTNANDGFTNPMLNIGFNFNYFGNVYNTVSLCTNGYLTFGAFWSQYINEVLPGYLTNVIGFAWTDLENPTGGTVTYQTMGTAPFRKFIVNLNSVPVYNTTNITTQVILYESTNLIEIHETTVPLHNYTQGIEDATGTLGYAPPGRNNLSFSATNDAYQFVSAANYLWSPTNTFNTLSDSSSATPVASPTATTTYTVTLNPGSACTKTATVTVTVNPLPSPAGSISGPQVICAYQSGITYTCPSATNTTYYLWSVPSGSTIISGQGTTSINVSFGGNTGYISVLDSNACGRSLTYDSIPITVVSGLTDGYWIGGVSSDWFNAYNWCGAIPTSTYPPTAYIDGSVGMNNMYSMYMPIINSSGAVVNGLTMEGDLDTLTINGSNTLDVYGDWTMGVVWTDATFNPNSSTVNFKGNASQTITTYYPDMVTLTFNNLTINKGSSTLIVLEDVGVPISMTGNLSLINGLFKVTDVGSHVRFSSAPTIPSTAGLELNGGIL